MILTFDAVAQRAWDAEVAAFRAEYPEDVVFPLVCDVAERAFCGTAEAYQDNREHPQYERTMSLIAGLVIREAIVGWHRAGTQRAQG